MIHMNELSDHWSGFDLIHRNHLYVGALFSLKIREIGFAAFAGKKKIGCFHGKFVN